MFYSFFVTEISKEHKCNKKEKGTTFKEQRSTAS